MLYKIDSATKDIVCFPKQTTLAAMGWLEKDLENLLVRNIDTLTGTDLLVAFQERNWQNEPDLLAIDADGNSWIFELKRWSASSNDIHQLLGYAQTFGQAGYETLNRYYNQYKAGQPGTQPPSAFDLAQEHQKYFNLNSPLPTEQFNRHQILILVADGADKSCSETVKFWANKGLDLKLISVHTYEISSGEFVIEFPAGEELGAGAWLLNTNLKTGPNDEIAMLLEQKAAAYCDPWKFKIQKLRKGDRVFLYSNSSGIIATGTVDGKLCKKAYHGVPDEEYYVKLSGFKKAVKPLTPAQIKALGINLIYRQTLVSLDTISAEEILKHL